MEFIQIDNREDFLKTVSNLNCAKYYKHNIKYEFGETCLSDFNDTADFFKFSQDFLIILAIEKNELLAFMGLDFEDVQKLDDIYIHTLISARKGLGKIMIEKSKEFVSDSGFVTLCYEEDAVKEYYKKLGFIEFNSCEDGYDFLRFYKRCS